jgi:ribonuclease HI
MHAPVRIWLEVAHHQAFRIGGWALVRADGGAVSGTAGGERRITAARTGLTALAAALREIAPATPVELHTSSAFVLGVPARIAAAETGEAPPAEDLDLWAQAATSLRRLDVRIRRVALAPNTPAAFAAAWADFALQRAKDHGAFTHAIPKPNLAKAGVPA